MTTAGATASEGGGTSRRFELLVLACFALLVCVVAANHEPWKDETQAWRMAIDSDGIVELWRNSRYEGHPLLWHVVLQLLGHLSRSWWAVAALHVLIACAAAWLVLRYAPFTRVQKVLLVFGYFPAYEYAVVVRPYGLGVMLAFAAVVAWTAVPRRIGWTILSLVLLANTTVMGTLLALALVFAFAVDWAWPDDEAARPRPREMLLAGAATLAATLAVVYLVALQVMPPPDAEFKGTSPMQVGPGTSEPSISRWELASIPTVEVRALIPLVRIREQVEWNSWMFMPQSSYELGLLLLLSLVMLGMGALIASRRRVALLYYLVGTGGYIVFLGVYFLGAARHDGYVFIVWVIAAWLARAGPASARPNVLRTLTRHVERARPGLFTFSLIAPVLGTVELATADLKDRFADAKQVAEVIRAAGLRDAPIIAMHRAEAQPVAAFLDRPVLFPREGKSRTFVVWGGSTVYDETLRAADSAMTALLARECRVVVLSSPSQDVPTSIGRRARVIYTTQSQPLSPDRYRVWVASAPVSPRCPAGSR